MEYPLVDEDGQVWIDKIGMLFVPGVCFICGCNTRRWDTVYERYFCNSVHCWYEQRAIELQNQVDSKDEKLVPAGSAGRAGRHKR